LSIAYAIIFSITIAIMDTLGKRLKAARETFKPKKLTQKQVADRAGIAQATVADIERGRNETTTKLPDLAYAVSCSLNWLATGKGEMRGSDIPSKPSDGNNQTEPNLTDEQQHILSVMEAIGPEARKALLQTASLLAKSHQSVVTTTEKPHPERGVITPSKNIKYPPLPERRIRNRRESDG